MSSKFKSIPVLCYHKISDKSDINTSLFRSQLQLLADKGYTTITVKQLFNFMRGEENVPEKSVVLTFDDCHFDNWVNAIPILKEFNFKGVFFCITSFLHDTPKRQQGENRPDVEILNVYDSYVQAVKHGDYSQFMSKEEVYETVHTFGHEVYSHSASHSLAFCNTKQTATYPTKKHWSLHSLYDEVCEGTKLYELGSTLAYNGYFPKDGKLVLRSIEERAKYCREEMTKSKRELEYLLSQPCNFFCWPFGDFDRLSMQIAAEVGYLGTFTLERGPNAVNGNTHRINRIVMSGKTPLKKVEQRLRKYSNSITATIFSRKFKPKKCD